ADREIWSSSSQTDGEHFSTTFTRTGERTLLAVTTDEMATNATELSTFNTNVMDSSEAIKSSSVAQTGDSTAGSSTSQSDSTVPSTEFLFKNSSDISLSSVTLSLENKSLSGLDSSSTGSSSPSSSSSSSPVYSSTAVSSNSSSPSSSSLSSPAYSSSTVVSSNSSSPSSSSSSSPAYSSSTAVSSNSSSPAYSSSTVVSSNSSSPSSSSSSSSSSPAYSSSAAVSSNSSSPSSSSSLYSSSTAVSSNSSSFSSSSSSSFSSSPAYSSTAVSFNSSSPSSSSSSSPVYSSSTAVSSNSSSPSSSSSSSSSPAYSTTHVTSTLLPKTTQLDLSTSEEPATAKTTLLTSSRPHTSQPTTAFLVPTRTYRVLTDSSTRSETVTEKTSSISESTAVASVKSTERSVPTTNVYSTSVPNRTTEHFPITGKVTAKPSTAVQVTSTTMLMTSTATTGKVSNGMDCTNTSGEDSPWQLAVTHTYNVTRVIHLLSSIPQSFMTLSTCVHTPTPTHTQKQETIHSKKDSCSLKQLSDKGRCTKARTFIGIISLKKTFNSTSDRSSEIQKIQSKIMEMLNASLIFLNGYRRSTLKVFSEENRVSVSVLNTFSVASNITSREVRRSIENYVKACRGEENCWFAQSCQLSYRDGSLCSLQVPKCDNETSECTDSDGIAVCQCKVGYFKYSSTDYSCRACKDRYRLQNGSCVHCPFGFGGFNCGDPYKLITVVIAAAGGGLLLILGTALIITCCRKSKTDISKFIFKPSGDFRMSPYAEYPKNPRISVEWGRETIELQENGSTKNLLQMTDIYYS
uniref:EGF-like domain-containing protein n=1 Tax=Latimeria chalumnae TaxID=7897 RepID=H2ZW61_LATCH